MTEHSASDPASRRLENGGEDDEIMTATGATFDKLVLQAPGRIAVEFMTYGCAHCRKLEPALQAVANDVKSDEKVFRVNIAQDTGLAARYDITGTPTLVMFLDGQEVGRTMGTPPREATVLRAVTEPFSP